MEGSRNVGHAPSAAEQDYLKQIYHLQEETGRATTQQLATRLGVKPSSVTAMLKHLATDPAGPYVRHTPYRGVELTDKGRAVALEMLRHHRLSALAPGAAGTVTRIAQQEQPVLRYLQSLGLVPGAHVTVTAVAPYGDVLMLRIGDASHAVGGAPSPRVQVRPDGDGTPDREPGAG